MKDLEDIIEGDKTYMEDENSLNGGSVFHAEIDSKDDRFLDESEEKEVRPFSGNSKAGRREARIIEEVHEEQKEEEMPEGYVSEMSDRMHNDLMHEMEQL
jgi:hypothetical protein